MLFQTICTAFSTDENSITTRTRLVCDADKPHLFSKEAFFTVQTQHCQTLKTWILKSKNILFAFLSHCTKETHTRESTIHQRNTTAHTILHSIQKSSRQTTEQAFSHNQNGKYCTRREQVCKKNEHAFCTSFTPHGKVFIHRNAGNLAFREQRSQSAA